MKKLKHIYGPVSSWRLGRSLGIDLLSGKEKICNYDCIYCQLGRTRRRSRGRNIFVPTKTVIDEIKMLPPLEIDCVTFSGRGEPTLARNLGEMIRKLRKMGMKRIAVITNSSLIFRKDVCRDLDLTDVVLAKFDCSREMFEKINRPSDAGEYESILAGLKAFSKNYEGYFAIQVMFTKLNQPAARAIAEAVRDIEPDEVHINTPLRPSAAKPLDPAEVSAIAETFHEVCAEKIAVTHVYESHRKRTDPLDVVQTLRCRGARD